MVGLGISLAFIMVAALVAAIFFGHEPGSIAIIAAAGFGAYLAINIGANDVANNMGPAVGSGVISMGTAIAIAAVCEASGAFLAGGDVVATISQGIIDPASVSGNRLYTWAMIAALVSAAMWVNLATFLGAPVSTTHTVVGGVLGAGIAAAGLSAVNWPTMGAIAVSWVLSPVLGGVIAASVLAFIKTYIVYQDDKIAAARKWVPVLIAVMAGTFATYFTLKVLQKIANIHMGTALLAGIGIAIVVYLISVPLVRHKSQGLENRNRSLKVLFGIPLVISAALLSFAHGANDVANAVGPLAGVVHAEQFHEISELVTIPIWIMIIGAFGLSFGLILFGPKMIRLVGGQITKLNPMRAYCVALSAAFTVILASWLGLPVSSTHIAIGGVFGVGFFREWHGEVRARDRRRAKIAKPIAAEERRRRKLVRRSHFMTIVAAWLITVPATAMLSAVVFFGLNAAFG